MAETVLVTGGAGFIGSHVVDELIDMGHTVVVLDDLSGGFRRNVNPRAAFIEGSVTDEKIIRSIFKKYSIRYIYHLAAYAAEGLSHFIKRFNYENNVIGSVNLINAAVNNGCACFVFTSSIAVYGKNQLPMTEENDPQPEDSYGIAKYSVEQELEASRKMFGLNYVIFRPHNVYGERQNIGDKYRNVIGIFMNQIMSGKPLTIFGDGTQSRAFTYITDISNVIARAPFVPEAYNQVFNVGADTVYPINQLAGAVKQVMVSDLNIVHLPERNEVKHAFSQHKKVKKYFGCKSTVTLEEGLKKMAGWAKNVGAQKSKSFKNIEIMKNLPPTWAGK